MVKKLYINFLDYESFGMSLTDFLDENQIAELKNLGETVLIGPVKDLPLEGTTYKFKGHEVITKVKQGPLDLIATKEMYDKMKEMYPSLNEDSGFGKAVFKMDNLPSRNVTTPSSSSSISEDYTFLERKYGKEPKISAKEYARIRWDWH